MLIRHSWAIGVLPTLEHCVWHLHRSRHGSVVDTYAKYSNCEMDRISNSPRRWPWDGHPNGKSHSIQNHQVLWLLTRSNSSQPIIAIQNTLPAAQVSLGMSLAIFSQTFGGALFLSFAQTTFNSGLMEYVPAFAAGVNPQTVIDVGAYAVRQAVPKAALQGVLEAYNKSINHVFYLATGAGAATFVFCWGMGWKSIKKAKKVQLDA